MVGGLLSININYSPQEQHCQRQATRLVLARECGRAYKQAHCTYIQGRWRDRNYYLRACIPVCEKREIIGIPDH